MDLLFICRNAQEDSVIGNIGMAMEAKKAGLDVAVAFTGEALAALAGQAFNWSPLFLSRDARAKVSRNADKMGIPAANAKDARWTDMKRLIKGAKEAGIRLLACPLWTQILGVDGSLPQELDRPGLADYLRELQEAKTVIGGY